MTVAVRHFDYAPDAPVTRPAGGAVHVWAVRGDESAPVLTAAETDRAARYLSPAARSQFVAGRSALRTILGRLLGLDPLAVPVEVGPDGKPRLGRLPAGAGPAVGFNVSHTAGLGLVAVAETAVGVDVERVRPVSDPAGLVRRYFTPAEAAEYGGLPAEVREAAFFRGWTVKEAVLKGIGCGMRDMTRCVVRLDPRVPVQIIAPADTAAGWAVAEWRPAAGYVAAVGLNPGGWR